MIKNNKVNVNIKYKKTNWYLRNNKLIILNKK